MAHYAFLDDDNLVVEVIVGIDENELIDGIDPETWYGQFRKKKCKRTSYNHKIRKQFAGLGFFYDEINDVFIAPKPFPSWSLNDNFDWEAPLPRPSEDFYWNEDLMEWVNGKIV
jgi:hypothetical protein